MTISGIQLRCGPEHYAAFSVTLAATVTAGLMDKREDTVGVYYEAGESGDKVTFVFKADRIVVAKDGTTGGITFTAGDKVYYNDYLNKVTSNASGNTLIGIALEDADEDATTIEIYLDGTPRS